MVCGSAGLAGARCTDMGLCGKMSAVMPSGHARSIRKSTPVLNYGRCVPYLIIAQWFKNRGHVDISEFRETNEML